MLKQLLDLFTVKNITNNVDNFSNYELKFVTSADIQKLKELNKDLYDNFNSEVSYFGYEWSLEIEECNYFISQAQFNEIETDNITDNEDITVNLIIFKKGIEVVIFDEKSFLENATNMDLESILKKFNSKFKEGIIFKNDKSEFRYSSNYIGYNQELKTSLGASIKLSNQCNFNNFSEFKFTPDNFDIEVIDPNDKLVKLLNKIFQAFILIYIFDTSEITKNEIKLKISGFKTIEYNLDFKGFKINSLNTYIDLFQWIYSEKNKIEDKIGITRNILSIYLKDENILIDYNTFNSILSANKTYIKGNISKYIETRNKIHEQIEQVSTKVNTSLEAFYNNFQKSIFVFISFYLTIFVLKIYTKTDITTVINKEATLMAIGLLLLSLLFLFFSNWILNLEKKRISVKYENVKNRALDLLLMDDIVKILNDDAEYKSELEFLEKRRCLYNNLWVITLIVFFIILFITSDYINFKFIDYWEYSKNIKNEISNINSWDSKLW